jgi:hypothetical protein
LLLPEPGDLMTDEWWDKFDTEVFGHTLPETDR